jgi:lipopolysaccharide export system permease protein
MKTVRNLLYRSIAGAVAFVTLAFLSLFFFIDFVDELQDVGRNGYTLTQAVLACFAEQPGHFYELFPIAVLIGSIFALSRMAQSSEFTILRTGGLSPGRALKLLGSLAAAFALLNFLVGDFGVPWSEKQVVAIHNQSQGGRDLGRAGAWLKDRRITPEGEERQVSVNVQRTDSSGHLQGVRIFEMSDRTGLRTRVSAERAQIGDGFWELENAQLTEWPVVQAGTSSALEVQQTRHAKLRWPSNLDAGVVAAAVLPLATMSTVDLWRYSEHLSAQGKVATRHAIQFWKKALYPFSCFVMVALALPFAYLNARRGGISGKVFGGVLLGISFVLLNNVAGHLGVLREWTPWLAAAAPSALYFALSMAAFTWLIRYR